MKLASSFLSLALLLGAPAAAAPAATATSSAAASSTTVTFDNRQFVNKGLVAFGRIANDATDSEGETIGGVGSAIALVDAANFQSNPTGTSSGLIRLNPDRGHNTVTTTDYRSRSHLFQISFTPYDGSSTAANLQTQYQSSLLYKLAKSTSTNGQCVSNGCKILPPSPKGNAPGPLYQWTTGLDANSSSTALYSPSSSKHVNLPLNSADSHLSVDQEGFVVLPNGAGYILSDEYGPYIHFALPSGEIIYSLRPPPAIVPQTSDGTDRFTAETQPAAGRADNQGFEALTFDVKTSTLWAMLQSATIQDSVGGDKTTNRNTRLFGWTLPNGGDFRKIASPDVQLKYEYAVQLPASKKGKTYAQSEMTIIDSTTFLVLSRDGNGFGDTSSSSGYKQADLISTKAATNLAGTAYDQPGTPIAPQGTLLSSITPVAYASFVNLIDPAQLAKFGLHNGGAIDANLIASKLESLAIAPAGDASAPDDYLLFVVSDNDFITANGHQKAQVGANATYAGDWVDQPYSDAYAQQYGSADTQLFVYRLTLPGFDQFS